MGEQRRAVVTGIGAVTPLGNDAAQTWEGLKSGRSGIGPITLFDTENFKAKLAAEVHGFDPKEYMEVNEALRTDRYAQFAVAAAQQAAEESRIEGAVEAERFAVLFGTGIGGITTFEKEHTKLLEKGARRVSPLFVPMMIGNMAAGLIAIRHGCQGPAMPAVTACASGSNAIGEALRLIRHGYADAVITGGAEAAICPSAVAGFANMQALSCAEDPEAASLPFDRRLWPPLRRLPHHVSSPGCGRRRAGDDAGDAGGGLYRAGYGVCQRPRHGNADERRAGNDRH